MLNYPISYLLLSYGMVPEITMVVAIIISQLCLVARLYFLHTMVQLPVARFVKEVYLNVILVTIISAIPPYICYTQLEPSLLRFLLLSILSVATSAACIYYIGCNREERKVITTTLAKVKRKILRL